MKAKKLVFMTLVVLFAFFLVGLMFWIDDGRSFLSSNWMAMITVLLIIMSGSLSMDYFFREPVSDFYVDPIEEFAIIRPGNTVPIVFTDGDNKVTVEMERGKSGSCYLIIFDHATSEYRITNGSKNKWIHFKTSSWRVDKYRDDFKLKFYYPWRVME
jgi:hypothetical protein